MTSKFERLSARRQSICTAAIFRVDIGSLQTIVPSAIHRASAPREGRSPTIPRCCSGEKDYSPRPPVSLAQNVHSARSSKPALAFYLPAPLGIKQLKARLPPERYYKRQTRFSMIFQF